MPETGDVTDVRLYSHLATGTVRLAICDNGAPKTLLWQSGVVTNTATAAWLTVPVSSGAPSSLRLTNGTYWLAFQTDSPRDVSSYTAGATGDGFQLMQTFGSFPSTVSGEESTSYQWSEYVTYELMPFVDVTNGDATVTYDVTACTIGGTNNAAVVGMTWSNAANAANGTLAAGSPWSVTNVPLSVGGNAITVRGTNNLGTAASDTVTITRGGLGTGMPFVDVSNGNATVTYDVTACAIGGTNNAQVVGTMVWSNAANAANGTLAAGNPWSVPVVPLSVGENTITVRCTNGLGVVASDNVTITRNAFVPLTIIRIF